MALLRILLAAALFASCGAEPIPGRPDVVILMLDTTRTDSLGAYIKDKESPSPFLDEVAKKSMVFDNAWCASTCTTPSIASMFSGLIPPRHGVESNLMAQAAVNERNGESDEEFLRSITLNALPTSVPTITQHLSAVGYQTIGIGANPNFCEAFGFDRGFDHFSPHPGRDAKEMSEEWRKIQANLDPDKPTFTYMHYIDPHAPYNQRAPWCPHDGPKGCSGLCRYFSEVSYMDDALKNLFEEAKWFEDDNTIVVVVTDHGEEFGEHGNYMHRFSVHEDLARAGLFVYGPGIEPGRTATPAHHIDLLPTILALVNLAPPEIMDGKILFEDLKVKEDPLRPLLTCREDGGKKLKLWALTVRGWRLFEEVPTGELKLYNIKLDPRETTNLAETRPKTLAVMLDKLNEMRDGLAPVANEQVKVDLSYRLNEKLRMLGYVDGGDEGGPDELPEESKEEAPETTDE